MFKTILTVNLLALALAASALAKVAKEEMPKAYCDIIVAKKGEEKTERLVPVKSINEMEDFGDLDTDLGNVGGFQVSASVMFDTPEKAQFFLDLTNEEGVKTSFYGMNTIGWNITNYKQQYLQIVCGYEPKKPAAE